MKVSVIIPAYNAQKYLPLTLDSVLRQTFPDWQMVIVDDGSRDATGAIADAYAARDSRIQSVHQENHGLSAARNRGFALSPPQAEAVIFLDADDLWEPDLLSALLAALEAQPACVGAYAVARYIDGEGRACRPGFLEDWVRARRRVQGRRAVACRPEEPTAFASLAVRQYVATAGTLLLRRTALEAAGPFDEALNGCEDYDMWLRLTRFGAFAFVDRVLFGYRLHAGSLSDDRRAMHRTERDVRRKQIGSPENTPQQKRTLVAGFRLQEWESYRNRMRGAGGDLRRGRPSQAARLFLYGQANLLRSLHGRP